MDILPEEDKQLFHCYFQRSSDYYVDRLEKYRAGKIIIFNPYALLCGFFWFLFRKLYVEFFIIIIFLIVEGEIENYLFQNTELYLHYNMINRILTLIFGLCYGLFANYFYFKKASKQVELAKNKFTDHQDRMEYLFKKGGTTMIPVIIAILLFVTLLLINLYDAFSLN